MDLKHSEISFEVQKLTFEGQKLTFEGCFETKTTFKNILEYSRVIPAQFPYIKHLFLSKIDGNQEKSRKNEFLYKIPHFYPLWGAYL